MTLLDFYPPRFGLEILHKSIKIFFSAWFNPYFGWWDMCVISEIRVLSFREVQTQTVNMDSSLQPVLNSLIVDCHSLRRIQPEPAPAIVICILAQSIRCWIRPQNLFELREAYGWI